MIPPTMRRAETRPANTNANRFQEQCGLLLVITTTIA